MPIPGEPESRVTPTAMRQIVVKLTTKQRLTVIREDPEVKQKQSQSGKQKSALQWQPRKTAAERRNEKSRPELENTDIAKDQAIERTVTEYVVLHQRMLRGVIEEWKIWGFTEPSTMESIAKSEQFERDMGDYEAARAA